MAAQGVLFDFSGTLFRLENEQAWLATALHEAGAAVDDSSRARLLDQLTTPTGDSVELPAEYAEAWARRDLDPALHQKVYHRLLTDHGATPEIADRVYDQLISPDNWFAYPDTGRALRELRAAGVAVGVVSNIAWDIRVAFARYGLHELVDCYVLSYEFGATKPDARIFEHACAKLGLAPEQTLMVGDSAEADGGATAIGAGFAQVDPLPTAERPDALLALLEAHDLR
ncbi:HAD superfamily hydrolase (TIGR01493 family)/HAD superfamily hydrolase (TIGR01509 family)/HAD superfamily hydrolase (TIGR01549 family) [Tamaricihabitans halophyticus]|uniref:HAD superfamily hydrolase (TIGR01493 family)/HAD superfamily hydrolase (TIGR01509 family)/HAD superfamily hydrolase (TIGR01549 family) n=1 Tax=Tamaricihabitans halophyticus TaxID=1262583 RepID=A0A4R2R1V3_9PSEU|nr:HAD-IA family hydrolase [Tamaricihabitans halophyticus]TCP56672.1 HAD superfamily hydrolase (TIGR01493 family)/HAD superfamily hydrolase (TIGR01509 family)/HAD superfamily hydrolase (TIGR01549 family) [Tamaricihabitans halophyticus]